MSNHQNSTYQRAAQMLAAAADVLDQGQAVNRISIAVTAIALGALLLPLVPTSAATQPTAAIVAVLGLAELYLAGRVAVCGARFRRLGEEAAAERLDMNGFDAALITLGLSSTKKAGRPVGKRFLIARRMLIAQVAAFGLQVVATIAGASLVLFSGV